MAWPFSRNQQAPPPGYTYPASHPSTAGGGTNVPLANTFSAPMQRERPDVVMNQRLSERILAFAPRLPMQTWLREQETIAVLPSTTHSHHLGAPSPRRDFGARDDPTGTIFPGGIQGGAGTRQGGSVTAWQAGMYRVDYSMQTQQGAVRGGAFFAPPALQSVPGYVDATTSVLINSQYSMVNSDLATLYMNIRAPSPWEGMVSCQ